ncbi:MAG: phage holin [Candidatus Sedimenticola sp. (ex Thyasira tokunagai)]
MGSILMPDKIADLATGTSYTVSAGTMVVGGLTINEIAAVGGLLLGFATFAVNWVYRHKHFKLAKQDRETPD